MSGARKPPPFATPNAAEGSPFRPGALSVEAEPVTRYHRVLWWLALLGGFLVLPAFVAWPLAARERRRIRAAGRLPSRTLNDAWVLSLKVVLLMGLLLVLLCLAALVAGGFAPLWEPFRRVLGAE